MRVRAKYNATGTDKNPYLFKGQKPSKAAVLVGIVYLLAARRLARRHFSTSRTSGGRWSRCRSALWLAVVRLVFLRLARRPKFHQSRLNPVIHARYTSMLRVGFITGLFTFAALTWQRS